ncbi:neuritin isoform 2-T2 [Hipposideros larvatus]
MGLKLNGRYISLILAVQIAYLVQAVRAAGKCDAVFKGFSDCLLKLGDNMATYPQGLDDKTNIKTVCTPWPGTRCLRRRYSLGCAEEECSAGSPVPSLQGLTRMHRGACIQRAGTQGEGQGELLPVPRSVSRQSSFFLRE